MIRNIYILLLLSLSFGTVTDIDGNVYETVVIGDQLWMAENLKVTHYNDGSEIPNITNNGAWSSLTTGAYRDHDNNPTNSETYGRLYNGFVVDDDRGVCPEGWHVPSDDEWTTLITNIDENAGDGGNEGSQSAIAGGKMKEVGTEYWNSPNTGATNESGFTGLGVGCVDGDGVHYSMGQFGYFWSSSEYNSKMVWSRWLRYNGSSVSRYMEYIRFGMSIRCLQDEITTGCTDPDACNYDGTVTVDDGSCIYPDDHHDCYGNCLVELDCAGNCCVIDEDGCYWQETGPCGEPGPSNGMDSCGVCGGDNSSCADCAGVPCSDAYVDMCGICDDDPTNDCVQGCDGAWGGGAELDECGVCDGDGSSCADTDGDGCLDDIDDAPFEWDDDYDGDGLTDDCDADDDNDGASDADDSDDNNEYVCSDVDMDTCDDCSSGTFDPQNDGPDYNANGMCDEGDINDTDGDGVVDDEDSDPFNPYQCADSDGDGCDDCGLGYYNPADDGSDYDADGICDLGDDDDDNDGVTDLEDCHPFDPALSEYDCCGVCGGDNSQCSNCCGMPFPDNCSEACYEDYCGVCDDIPENDCVQDCAGTWGGDAVVDECGVCGGDNTSCQQLGDINGDGTINVIDIVMVVDLILNDDYDVVGDVNEDGQLNVIDIVILVDWVLNGMPEADSDGDGVIDDEDSDPNNPYQCSDLDGDTCDDCSTGHFNPSDDGYDYDGDGQCDAGDCDDDNDGCQECWDYCP